MFFTKAQTITKEKLDSFVTKWLGRPYVFGGESYKGIDCSAFTQKFYKDILNINIPRTSFYQMKHSIKKTFDSLSVGDIIFFKSKYSPTGLHCGIFIGNGEFIHAANSKLGVIISCIYDEKYIKNIKSIGNF